MSAELLHAVEWDTEDIQHFVGLGIGRDEVMLYHFHAGSASGTREFGFDTVDVARCFDYSPSKRNLIGYGVNSGSVYVRDMNSPQSHGSIQLKPEATKRCNALSFSGSNFVASAYERIRQQSSILIWDLMASEQQHVPVLSIPIQETVNALRFVPHSITQLMFGESRRIAEFDTRSNDVAASIHTPLCFKLEFNKVNTNIFASYGESNLVALWDRRMIPQGSQNTAEPILLIPRVFKDQKIDNRCFRFSLSDENELAVLQGNSRIRRWQLSSMPAEHKSQTSHLSSGLMELRNQQQQQTIDTETNLQPPHAPPHGPPSEASSPNSSVTSYSRHNSASTSARNSVSNTNLSMRRQSLSHDLLFPQHQQQQQEQPIEEKVVEPMLDRTVFVNRVYNVKTETDKVVSFDYSWNHSTHLPEFVCVRQSGTIYRMPIVDPPSSIHFDPFNVFHTVRVPYNFVDATTEGIRTADINLNTAESQNMSEFKLHAALSRPPVEELHIAPKSPVPNAAPEPPQPQQQQQTEQKSVNSMLDVSDSEDEKDTEATSDEEGHLDTKVNIEDLLKNDIITTMRLRALAGYSLDAQCNIQLLTSQSSYHPDAIGIGSSSIVAAWKWVALQQDLINQPNNYLSTPDIDLRYVGVASVWGGLNEESLKYRSSRQTGNSKYVDDAIKYAVRKSPGSAYVSVSDKTNDYRQLGLRISGWNFGLSELETKLLELEAEGKFEKAAGWAVFHNDVERAVESLAKSGKKNLRLMSTAIAGYLVYKDVPSNNVWREQCRRLASELSSPYLRAIFAYISDNSWLDVLDDGALPLTERIGIALRFLPEKEVGKYLSTLTSRAIVKGDLEGIILTGFTPKVIDLLQAYLDRSGDIQTVCLLSALAWPRFVDDNKFAMWFKEYRQLLNSWQYFTQRARLDIARNKLDSQHTKFQPPITRQAYLRCAHCKKMISWDNNDGTENTSPTKHKSATPQHKSGVNNWKVWNRCPSCNHQLPSCGVCTNSLGPCIDDEVESDRWPTFCLKCNHAFHSVHARQWFQKYDMCPIPTCKCYCSRSVSTVH